MSTTKTDHADLLNALDGMQRNPIYALRHDVLRQAELLIVRHECEIADLRAQLAARIEPAEPVTRLDVMSLIHSQMHRVYASAIDREEIDSQYIREIEDSIMGLYHGRYIAGYDLRKSEEAPKQNDGGE